MLFAFYIMCPIIRVVQTIGIGKSKSGVKTRVLKFLNLNPQRPCTDMTIEFSVWCLKNETQKFFVEVKLDYN